MLRTLTVWNFALIEHVEIEFGNGLNILTGETGAGKSILIDALGAALGYRLSTDAIRTGAEWLRVEAVFDIDGSKNLLEFLEEQAITPENGTIIITRQITSKGKNVILVNGSHITVAVLKTIGEFLADIHGQHESLALRKSEQQFLLIDGSDPDIPAILDSYSESFSKWKKLEKIYLEKKSSAKDLADRIDMLRWQAQEIESAALTPGEDEENEKEINKLSNSEKISENLESACSLLGEDESGILDSLAILKRDTEYLGRYDENFENSTSIVEEAEVNLKELFYALRDAMEEMEFDPERLDALQGRMALIDRLKKKYGGTVKEILDYYEKTKSEIEELENYDSDIEKLEKEMTDAENETKKRAEALTKKRNYTAKKVAEKIEERLKMLGMPDAKFKFQLTKSDLSPNGADSIDILFSANAGEREKPLSKVASGGELSRISLAIKAVSAAASGTPDSMVFDEIDTGIGGKTAQMVAECIALVAAHRQVLCITHLPQIASMADTHFHIQKSTHDEKTITTIKRLGADERADEIAAMATGAETTSASRVNAKEMLTRAEKRKKELAKSQGDSNGRGTH